MHRPTIVADALQHTSANTRLLRRKARVSGIVLFLLCEIFRLSYSWVALPAKPIGLTGEPQRVAVSLLEKGTFSDPYAIETGKTAHMAPLQPLILSGIVHVFGRGEAAERAKEAWNVTLASIRAALMPVLAFELGMPLAVGVVAGVFTFWPGDSLEIDTPFDAMATALLLVWAVIRAQRYGWGNKASSRFALLEGGIWGVILLFNTSALTVLLALVLTGLWRERKVPLGTFARNVTLTLVALMVTISPWIARNYASFERFVFIRDNVGLELAVSNHDSARASTRDNPLSLNHPNMSTAEAQSVREHGEIEYNELKLRQALAWIRSHPGQFASLTWQRIIYFWFPGDLDRRYRYPVWLFTVLSLAGLCWMAKRREAAALPLVLIAALYPLIYYALQGEFRYRAPIYAFNLLTAAYLVVKSFEAIFSEAMRKKGWSV